VLSIWDHVQLGPTKFWGEDAPDSLVLCLIPVSGDCGREGSGIIDFEGNMVAEAVGVPDTVIMAEIDLSREPVLESDWWTAINGTDNYKAMQFLSRRPETFKALKDPDPPVMPRYPGFYLTSGDRERQLETIRSPRERARKT